MIPARTLAAALVVSALLWLAAYAVVAYAARLIGGP